MKTWYVVVGMAGLSAMAPAKEPAKPRTPPEVFQKLIDCKAIPDSAQRLSCFEAATDKMEAAFASENLYITDRNQVREARRSLFGLPMPNIGKLFGGSGEDEEEEQFTTIHSTIQQADDLGYGKMQLVLADGAVWQTTEVNKFPPHKGQTIEIRRGLAGGYMMRAGKGADIRIKRIR